MNNLTHVYRLVPPLLVLSLVTNLTILISPLFMMQVLDRVIPSGNQNTLLLLGLLAMAALTLQACIEIARDLCLKRLANWVERSGTDYALSDACDESQSVINQVGSVAGFLAGPLAPIVLSLPWFPLLAFTLFLLHPLFVVLLFVLVLISVANKTIAQMLERPGEALARWHADKEQECLTLAAKAAKNGETSTVSKNLRQRFSTHQNAKLDSLEDTYRVVATKDALSSLLRQAAQILTLALGAFLVTEEILSAGGMIAASILLAKTYGTAEGAIGQFPAIKASIAAFHELLARHQVTQPQSTNIPDLSGALRAESLVFPRGGGAPPRLDRVGLALKPGECLAVIGASGSGKTTLLKALAGISPAPIGSVFYDESETRGLSEVTLFSVAGYLPQRAQLLPGTIAENISCFDPSATDEQIVDAAKRAGVHGLISALPDSYDTDLETNLHLLSAGQKQRVALARAIFNDVKYLFLDEPNALLDAEGERALNQILNKLKEDGTTIVMVLHRSGLMGVADKVMRLEAGRCVDLGDRYDVLSRMQSGNRQIVLPRLMSSTEDLSDWISSQFTRTSDVALNYKADLIATAMFTAFCESGGRERASKLTVNFAFKDDNRCEVTLIENGASNLPQTLSKVQDILETSPALSDTLNVTEHAFASVLQLADQSEMRVLDGKLIYKVNLSDLSNSEGTDAPQEDTKRVG